jgi:protein phosphatase
MAAFPLYRIRAGVAPSSRAIRIVASSHAGWIHNVNEDSFAIDEGAEVAVLADGMGGQSAGKLASRIATDVVSTELRKALPELRTLERNQETDLIQSRLRQIMTKPSRQINNMGREFPEMEGMGTTIDLAVLLEEVAYLGHVGDGRIFQIRNGNAKLVTKDHSMAQVLVDAGETGPEKARMFSNILVRVLGASPFTAPDITRIDLFPKSALVLCSDGVWSHFQDPHELAELVTTHWDNSAEMLIEKSLERGGEDNATAVVILIDRL